MVVSATYNNEYLCGPRYERLLILVPGVAITGGASGENLPRSKNSRSSDYFEPPTTA
jgi:hypothetical protein